MPTSGSPGRVIRQRTARWAREGLESKGQLTHPLEAQLLVFVVRQAALHGLLVHTFHVLVLVLLAVQVLAPPLVALAPVDALAVARAAHQLAEVLRRVAVRLVGELGHARPDVL
jgi:hypothetical protein